MTNGDRTRGRKLIRYGLLLFLLGLLTGFVLPSLHSPRMGLSAHLEAVMNGTFLIALGCAWREVALSPRLETAAYRLALYGAYVNWASVLLGAATGAGRLTPIAAGGKLGAPWAEAVVSFGLVSIALAIVAAVSLVLFGLWGDPQPADAVAPTQR